MRVSRPACFALLLLGLLFQLPSIASAGEFTGVYTAVEDPELTLQINEAADGTVTGSVAEGEARFPLKGSAAKGQLSFTANVEGETIRCAGQLKGNRLTLTLAYADGPEGEGTEEMIFVRKMGQGKAAPPPPQKGGWGQPTPPAPPTPEKSGWGQSDVPAPKESDPAPETNPLGRGPTPATPDGGINPLATPADPLVGSFADERVTLNLARAAPGSYSGALTIEGRSYAVEARGSAQSVTGTFTVEGHKFPLSGELKGDTFHLSSEGATYQLTRQAAPPPSPSPPPTGNPLGTPSTPAPGPATPEPPAAPGQGQGQQPTPPGTSTPAATAGLTTYRHPTGLQLQHPSAWRVTEGLGGLSLVPPELAQGPGGDAEAYLLFGQLAPNVQQPSDPAVQSRLAQTLQQFAPFLRPTPAGAQPVQGTTYPTTRTSFEGTSPFGRKIRADVYATVTGAVVQTLVAIGEPPHLARRKPAIETILKSFETMPPSLDRALVGTWYAQRYSSTGRPGNRLNHTTQLVSQIKADGTFEYSSKSAFASPGGTGEGASQVTIGRWAAANGVVYLMAPGEAVTALTYQISGTPGDRGMTTTPAGAGAGAEKQLWTERP